MNPVISKKERVFHAILFELLAVVSSVIGLTIFTDHDVASLSGTLIVVAMIAMCWNVIFNWIFDQFSTGPKEKRSLSLRVFHVIIFEAGLLLFTVPVMAYLLKTSMWNAFIMDLGVSIFITIYAFVYNLVYDHARAYICRTKQINEAVS